MTRHPILPIVLAALLLVLGLDYATFAATGDSLILGKTNKASKTTKIQRTTAGPVVTLKAKQSTNPPFATNAKGKVKNLNADTLDGIDSVKLGVRPIVFTKTNADYGTPSSVVFPLTGVPAGRYLAAMNFAINSTDVIALSQCDLVNTTTDTVAMIARGDGGTQTSVVTAAGYAEVAAGEALTLTCYITTAGNWGTLTNIPWRLALTPVAGTVAKTLTP